MKTTKIRESAAEWEILFDWFKSLEKYVRGSYWIYFAISR